MGLVKIAFPSVEINVCVMLRGDVRRRSAEGNVSAEDVQHAAGDGTRVHVCVCAGSRREIDPQESPQTRPLQAEQVTESRLELSPSSGITQNMRMCYCRFKCRSFDCFPKRFILSCIMRHNIENDVILSFQMQIFLMKC